MAPQRRSRPEFVGLEFTTRWPEHGAKSRKHSKDGQEGWHTCHKCLGPRSYDNPGRPQSPRNHLHRNFSQSGRRHWCDTRKAVHVAEGPKSTKDHRRRDQRDDGLGKRRHCSQEETLTREPGSGAANVLVGGHLRPATAPTFRPSPSAHAAHLLLSAPREEALICTTSSLANVDSDFPPG